MVVETYTGSEWITMILDEGSLSQERAASLLKSKNLNFEHYTHPNMFRHNDYFVGGKRDFASSVLQNKNINVLQKFFLYPYKEQYAEHTIVPFTEENIFTLFEWYQELEQVLWPTRVYAYAGSISDTISCIRKHVQDSTPAIKTLLDVFEEKAIAVLCDYK